MKQRAVVLLSGGLDSAVALAIAQHQGYDCLAISFNYGQRHVIELRNAAAVAEAAGVPHVVYVLDVSVFAGSALTTDVEMPRHESVAAIPPGKPATYVPARNTIMLSYALAAAETFQAMTIFIGVNRLDDDGYPDCRREYMDAFQKMASLATWAGIIKIATPLIDMTKAQIITRGFELDVDMAQTLSCYDPDGGVPCRECDACLLRIAGFADAGLVDS